MSLEFRVGGKSRGGVIVAIVPPLRSSRQDEGGAGTKERSMVKGGKGDDSALQLETLRTLHTLLNGLSSPGLWRSMLSGCFAGLYRFALLEECTVCYSYDKEE
jgi:hypothetical protein